MTKDTKMPLGSVVAPFKKRAQQVFSRKGLCEEPLVHTLIQSPEKIIMNWNQHPFLTLNLLASHLDDVVNVIIQVIRY